MNRSLFLAASLLLVSAPLLHADGLTDPHTGIDDPPCNTQTGCPVPGPTSVSGALGTSFVFNANGSGGGISFFQTASGINTIDIETIDPFITSPDQVTSPDGEGCYSDVFVCTVTILGGVTDMYFQADAAIPAGDEFSINLNDIICNPFASTACDPNGSGGWISGEAFFAFPNLPTAPTTALISTPEPSTVSLLALGMLGTLGLLAAKNKKKSSEVLRVL